MHNAPAVSYPVGRSRFQAYLLGLVGSGGALVGTLWHYQANPIGWRWWFFGVVLAATGLIAARTWLQAPIGCLRWDGRTWSWTGVETLNGGSLTVVLDLQFCMVLGLCAVGSERFWLWPERRIDPTHWDALRRAVFSRGSRTSARTADDQPGLTESSR
jgi:hypothetical protein